MAAMHSTKRSGAPLGRTTRGTSGEPIGELTRALTRRGVIASGGAVAGGLALAACGPFTGLGGSESAAQKEPVTLRLSFPAGTAEHAIGTRGPVFEQRFPHVTLSFEPSSEYLEKLATQIASDTVSDLMFLESDDEAFYGFWAAKGALRQLDPFVARDKYDMSVFLPQAVEALKVVDGKLWAFPYSAFMARCGLFYNKNLFAESGLPIPTDDWTYDDIIQHAKRMTVRRGPEVAVWGGGRKFGGDMAVMAVTRAFGGDIYSADGKKTLLASPKSQEAISWWFDRSLIDQTVANDLIVGAGEAPGPMELFQQGKLAFLMGHNPGDRVDVARALNPAGVPWGLALMPKGPAGRRGGAFFNSPLGMAKITKHETEAWELQKFLAEKETGVIMGLPAPGSGQRSSHFGARKDVYQDKRVLSAPDMPPGVMAALARSMELPEPFRFAANFQAAAVEEVLNRELRKALRREVQYDSGYFENLAAQIQAILDQPAP
ncbi:MAG: ABC transporter substrate-binding protein [Chloroflexota bacterium]